MKGLPWGWHRGYDGDYQVSRYSTRTVVTEVPIAATIALGARPFALRDRTILGDTVRLIAEPLDGKPVYGKDRREKRAVLTAAPRDTLQVLHPHYPVCNICGWLHPCPQHAYNEAVEKRIAKAMRDLSLPPGFCGACQQPVTDRQPQVVFPGPHLDRPDLPDGSAVFHTRRACWMSAVAYDERWAVATGRRALLTCPGTYTRHIDASFECTNNACPGPWARHPEGGMDHYPNYRVDITTPRGGRSVQMTPDTACAYCLNPNVLPRNKARRRHHAPTVLPPTLTLIAGATSDGGDQ